MQPHSSIEFGDIDENISNVLEDSLSIKELVCSVN
jgi:hypothetical protein